MIKYIMRNTLRFIICSFSKLGREIGIEMTKWEPDRYNSISRCYAFLLMNALKEVGPFFSTYNYNQLFHITEIPL